VQLTLALAGSQRSGFLAQGDTPLKTAVKWLLANLDVYVVRKSSFQRMYARSEAAYKLDFLHALPTEDSARLFRYFSQSKAQGWQDLFVLSAVGFKEGGYFVEFGATDGLTLSNTQLLEKQFGWSGLLAEPARVWHEALYANRSATIDTRCVWTKSGEVLTFNETDTAELSTIDTFSGEDDWKKWRKDGRRYEVETISLNDLLDAHSAPSVIDYLSIDTEGSEFEILNAVDFDRYRFRVITCEHNFTPVREKVHQLLSRHGYQRKFENVSRWDDWYVLPGV
jgi:FkbM family methyltransferase